MQRLRAGLRKARSRAMPGLRPRLLKGLCQELADRRFPFRREAREAKRGPASEGERCSRQVPDGASFSGAARREAAMVAQADMASRNGPALPGAPSPSPHSSGAELRRENEEAWLFEI